MIKIKSNGKFERERERVNGGQKLRNKKVRFFLSAFLIFILVLVQFSLGSFLFPIQKAKAVGTTYYVSQTDGNDSYDGMEQTHTTGNTGPWKTLAKAANMHVNAGDTIALKRGNVWYEGLAIYYGGSAGNPVTWTAYGTGSAPIIKGSDLDTSWTNSSGSVYYTSYNMVVSFGGSADGKGVWEDGAPLYSVGSLATVRPGTFFYDSGTSRLYVQTYESDTPVNHIMEHSRHWYPTASAISIQDSTGGVATDYLIIENIQAENGQIAGFSSSASAYAKNNITLKNMVITNNNSGISYNGSFSQNITVQNCTIWGNTYSAIGAYNGNTTAATVNVTNSIIGGQQFFNTFYPATGSTINVDHSIMAGNLEGRYFLETPYGAGTLNVTNPIYKNPRFASGGGGGIATFNTDDYSSSISTYYTSVADIFNNRGLKWTWNIVSQQDSGQYSIVNNVLGKNQVIGIHSRNHDQLASAPNGSDIVNALAINYNGGTTATASYADPVLTLNIDGSATNINVSTENNRTCGAGTYDTTYLGDATHGLIGCINALSTNYTAAFPSTASANINRTGSTSPNKTSSRILADQGSVNIKSSNCPTTTGCIALDATRFYNSEIFTSGQRDGEYADWDAQTGAIKNYSTVSFAWPFEEYSMAGIARLYAKGFKTAYASDYSNGYLYAKHLSLNQLFPLSLPIAAPYASGEHMTLQTSQDGIDEGENVAAALSAYPTMFNLFSHQPSEVSLTSLTSWVDTLIANGTTIMDKASAVALQEASGASWDTGSYTLTRKIVPTINLITNPDSPAIDAGTNIGLTADCAGNPIYGLPDIGGYEYQPPHTMGTDKIDTGAGARVYGDGKFRDVGTTNSNLADLKITPSGGTFSETTSPISAWLDLSGITWSNTGSHHKAWTESNAEGGLNNTRHTIGDLEASKYYNVTVDDGTSNLSGCSLVSSHYVCQANSQGKINFTYTGGYSTHTFDVTEGDNTPPTTTASPAQGTYNSAQSVTLTCDDGSGVGCDKTYYTTNGDVPTTSSSVYSGAINISTTTTLKFFSQDKNLNSESYKTKTYTIDTSAPTGGAFTINSGATITNSASVTLNITCATDPWAPVQVAWGNSASPTNWVACASSKTLTLPSGDGSKTVYVRFEDGGGNATSDLTQSINLDQTAPTISDISSTTANGSYKSGSSINVRVQFSENVNITGTPKIMLQTNNGDQYAAYSSGTGTQDIDFSYTVQSGDNSTDLDYVNTSSLELNGGTIKDAASNDAILTLPSPSAVHSLGNNKDIILDTQAPTISDLAPNNTTLSVTTTSTNLTLATSETATCKYSTTSGTDYALMTAFDTTNAQSHSTFISGLNSGTTYNYYIKCQDTATNESGEEHLTFSIAPEENNISLSSIKVKIGREINKFKDTIRSAEKKIKLKSEDSNLANGTVEIFKNDKKIETVNVDISGAWNYLLKLKDEFSGWIKVRQYDAYGTLLSSDKAKIKVDTEDPKFAHSLPENITLGRNGQVKFTATDEDSGIDYYKVKLTDVRDWRQQNEDYYQIPENVPNGTYDLFIRAYDRAGNYAEEETIVNVSNYQRSVSLASANLNPTANQETQSINNQFQNTDLNHDVSANDSSSQTQTAQPQTQTQSATKTFHWWNPFSWF